MTAQEEIAKLKEQKAELEAFLGEMVGAGVGVKLHEIDRAANLFHHYWCAAIDILDAGFDYEPLPDDYIASSPRIATDIERIERIIESPGSGDEPEAAE